MKIKTAASGRMFPSHIESLADLIYSEFRDDAEMLYASRKGLVRELKKNIRLLESVLSMEERQKLKIFQPSERPLHENAPQNGYCRNHNRDRPDHVDNGGVHGLQGKEVGITISDQEKPR